MYNLGLPETFQVLRIVAVARRLGSSPRARRFSFHCRPPPLCTCVHIEGQRYKEKGWYRIYIAVVSCYPCSTGQPTIAMKNREEGVHKYQISIKDQSNFHPAGVAAAVVRYGSQLRTGCSARCMAPLRTIQPDQSGRASFGWFAAYR
jgi:hypothetical protein